MDLVRTFYEGWGYPKEGLLNTRDMDSSLHTDSLRPGTEGGGMGEVFYYL